MALFAARLGKVVTLALPLSLLFAQDAPKLSFEAVSIRPGAMKPVACPDRPGSKAIGIACGGPGTSAPERYTGHSVQLKGLIQRAFGVEAFQVIGPDWIASKFYDIAAIVPPGATADQFKQMMRGMLEDRFNLRVHRETREFSGYNMVLAKGGLKLKENLSVGGCAAGAHAPGKTCLEKAEYASGIAIAQNPPDQPSAMTTPTTSGQIAVGRGVTMAYLAAGLQGILRGSVVIDRTGLEGKYDYRFEYAPPDVLTNVEFLAPSVFTAIEKDLGLKLEPAKTEVDCVVIDRIERPSEN